MTDLHQSSATRFDFRIKAFQKKEILRAAELLGMSLTEFAKVTLIDRAQEVVQQHSATVLSDRDRDIFLTLIDQDSEPGAAALRAAGRYKKLRDMQLERKSTSS